MTKATGPLTLETLSGKGGEGFFGRCTCLTCTPLWVVWGGIIRCREKQSNVAYALEIDDEMVSDKDVLYPPMLGCQHDWQFAALTNGFARSWQGQR